MKNTSRTLLATAIFSSLALIGISNPALAASPFSITDLGTLGGGYSWAGGISNNGQVVGVSKTTAGNYTAFLYNNGSMSNLGSLGGITKATSVNNNGQAVGWSVVDSYHNYSHAFLYSNGSMNDLGTLGGSFSGASSINDNGQVVGVAKMANYNDHAFLYSNGSMTDLGTLGGSFSGANSINDNGQIVGYADTASAESHAFLYSNGSMTDLGILGSATSINNNGQIVGYASTAPNTRNFAFLYSNGTITDLAPGAAGVVAIDINNNGQVVGNYFDQQTFNHAFFYSNGSMWDINDLIDPNSGWRVSDVVGINDLGQVAGTGILNGENHAFIMSALDMSALASIPTASNMLMYSPPTSTVPVPAAAWLLGSGLLGLLGVARKRTVSA